MKCFYKCFDKRICVEFYKKTTNLLNFWLKRFCPNIEQIELSSSDDFIYDMYIKFKKSDTYDYIVRDNIIEVFGQVTNNESFIAKFITQCFQKLLIEEDILIIPSSCISKNGDCLLIIGDFWQGKTSVAINMVSKHNYNLISDNYVAIKNGKVIGATKYISIIEEDINNNFQSIYKVNNRLFYENKHSNCFSNLIIVGFLLPYINSGDNNIHIISKEESKWYLYQKFTRLLAGETILYEGKLPSPIFLTKNNSKKILKIVDRLLVKNKIKYVSSSMDEIVKEGKKILCKGEMLNE